jgi:glycosyltransferase involved in cell wall biosynthesis
MRVLLLDTTAYAPSSPLFLEALEEVSRADGHEFAFFDEAPYVRSLNRSQVRRAAYRLLGRLPLARWRLNQDLLKKALEFRPDVVLVVKGALVARRTLQRIKKETGAVLVNYATDDPWNPAASTRDVIDAIPYYDLYACTKRAIIPDVLAAGCPRATFVPFGYKPAVHYPEQPTTAAERARFGSDVVFIGGCDADRVPYFEALVRSLPDVRLHLYGGYWDRHRVLRRYHRGFALGRDYRLALGGAKIALALVRRANRDEHAMRSFEIPACGGFMLAERTGEHLEWFEEGREAAYFGSPDELVEKVCYYLSRDDERRRIAEAGWRKVTAGWATYKARLVDILDRAGALDG